MTHETDAAFLLRVAAFAAHKHRTQRRKDADASPYINHPIELAHLLAGEGGVSDRVILAAALLHDTVEDTETTSAEIETHFGREVAATVMEVTDDKSLTKAQRKQGQIDHAPHVSHGAKLVKLADKICNLRDISDAPPAGWPTERKREYFEWARRVIEGTRGTSARLEALFDAEYARRP